MLCKPRIPALDADGRIVAIEVLDASRHLATGADLTKLTAA